MKFAKYIIIQYFIKEKNLNKQSNTNQQIWIYNIK